MTTARTSAAIEVAVGRLYESGCGAGSIGYRIKVVENCESTAWSDLEYHSVIVSPPLSHRSIKVSVAGLNERANRIGSMSVIKVVEHGELTSRSNLEDHSITIASALFRSSVKVPVASLNQRSCGKFTVSAVELEKRCERYGGRKRELVHRT